MDNPRKGERRVEERKGKERKCKNSLSRVNVLWMNLRQIERETGRLKGLVVQRRSEVIHKCVQKSLNVPELHPNRTQSKISKRFQDSVISIVNGMRVVWR